MKYEIRWPDNPSYENCFGFPYNTKLSFVPYINWLTEKLNQQGISNPQSVKDVLATVNTYPELLQAINELSVVEKNRKTIEELMLTILPFYLSSNPIAGIVIPFQPISVYATPQLKKIVGDLGDGVWNYKALNAEQVLKELIPLAGVTILEKFYKMQLPPPEYFKSRELDKFSGADFYFKRELNTQFVSVHAKGEAPSIAGFDLSQLKKEFYNTDFWLDHFPPEIFSFEGITIYRMQDLSDREWIARIEYTLLQTEALMSIDNVKQLEIFLHRFFKTPSMKLGVFSLFDYQINSLVLQHERWFGLVPLTKSETWKQHFGHSIYHKAIEEGKPLLIDDLRTVDDNDPLAKELLALGYQSIIVVPIFHEKKLLGILELASAEPAAFNFTTLLKLEEIIPLFTVAFQRTNDEFENRIQATVKRLFTAIHPCVEWKFREIAAQQVSTPEHELQPIETIHFNDVYPIYGQVDIRGSSEKRSEAVRRDIVEALMAAKAIFEEAYEKYPYGMFDEIIFRTEKFLQTLKTEMNSDDENSIMEFLQDEVKTAFEIVSDDDAELKKRADDFVKSFQSEATSYNKQRRDFDESLALINQTVGRILEEEERITQKMLPHYFERYMTDGVEYTIYLGQSLLHQKVFKPMLLDGFRLWQLINMVRVARETKKLLGQLRFQLQTTQLILCYSNPISIGFRPDDKRFEIMGAYNIRYEIAKKRIDKALIKDTKERVTQPDMIAIIYNRDKDQQLYEKNFNYLKARGFIHDKVERLELEPLQGMRGLRALRVQINYESDEVAMLWNEKQAQAQAAKQAEVVVE